MTITSLFHVRPQPFPSTPIPDPTPSSILQVQRISAKLRDETNINRRDELLQVSVPPTSKPL